jgi:hypothetical protein
VVKRKGEGWDVVGECVAVVVGVGSAEGGGGAGEELVGGGWEELMG